MWTALGLAAGTLISEDAALAAAAGLARTGVLSPLLAAFAVGLGIWVGDVALFLAGRLATSFRPVARYVDRRWPPTELQLLAARLERRAPWAILLSRVFPGSRVPLYVAAGAFQVPVRTFLVCTAAAVAIWTTTIVMGAQWLP